MGGRGRRGPLSCVAGRANRHEPSHDTLAASVVLPLLSAEEVVAQRICLLLLDLYLANRMVRTVSLHSCARALPAATACPPARSLAPFGRQWWVWVAARARDRARERARARDRAGCAPVPPLAPCSTLRAVRRLAAPPPCLPQPDKAGFVLEYLAKTLVSNGNVKQKEQTNDGGDDGALTCMRMRLGLTGCGFDGLLASPDAKPPAPKSKNV